MRMLAPKICDDKAEDLIRKLNSVKDTLYELRFYGRPEIVGRLSDGCLIDWITRLSMFQKNLAGLSESMSRVLLPKKNPYTVLREGLDKPCGKPPEKRNERLIRSN